MKYFYLIAGLLAFGNCLVTSFTTWAPYRFESSVHELISDSDSWDITFDSQRNSDRIKTDLLSFIDHNLFPRDREVDSKVNYMLLAGVFCSIGFIRELFLSRKVKRLEQ